jgi:ABC-type bacteriocin/lantibiotic exporter with double-glycine peptidase domain
VSAVKPRAFPATSQSLALVVCVLAGGCASVVRNTPAEAARGDGWVRVDGVTEVRQSTSDGCGAAALEMVLRHWGRPVSQDDIVAATSPAPDQGIRADALRDLARAQHLQAFVLAGEVTDLEREVRRNRPVLVGVVKRQGGRAYPHYEVVVALHDRRRRVLTLDPASGARERGIDAFLAEWTASGRLMIVVLPERTEARAGPP